MENDTLNECFCNDERDDEDSCCDRGCLICAGEVDKLDDEILDFEMWTDLGGSD
jgi:hypothetical protein